MPDAALTPCSRPSGDCTSCPCESCPCTCQDCACKPCIERRLAALLATLPTDHPLWRLTEAELSRSAVPILHAKILGGDPDDIAATARKLGVPTGLREGELARLRAEPEERAFVVATMLWQGLRLFRRSVREERWRADGGAALLTWLVNGSVLTLRDALRMWRADQTPRGVVLVDEPFPDGDRLRPERSVEEIVATRADLRSALGWMERNELGELARVIRLAHSQDLSPTAAARTLGMPARRLEYLFTRFRSKYPRMGEESS